MSAAARPRKLIAATRPEEGARILAARHGPPDARPAVRKDLAIRQQVQLGEVVWIVKNPSTLQYYQFKDSQWALIQLFDGTRTPVEIVEQVNQATGEKVIDLAMVLEFEEALRDMEMIEQSVAERSLTLLDKFKSIRQKRAEDKSEGFNIFFIMFHVLDPDRFLNLTVKYVRWIWRPPVVIATLIGSVWTVSVFINNWGPIWGGTKDLYHFFGKPFLDILHFFFILCIIGGIHEFAHAYTTKMYGGEVHDIGLALFYFTPAFYCDTSDSFMFENRWRRFWVTVAGIYIEAIICSLATALWVLSYPDSFLHDFAYKTMLLTGISTIFFNINPLMKVDGYHALSSILQLQDLREGSFRQLSAWFQKKILRLPVSIPVTTRRKRRLYAVYGLLAIIYITSVMFFIGRLFDNLYTKYFPDFAAVLLTITLYYIFRKRIRKATRVAKLFYLDKKELLMSSNSRAPLLAAAVALAMILLVPWSRRTIRSDAVLKPVEEVRVQAPEDAVVRQALIHEGDRVEKDQTLFVLASPAAEEEAERSLAQHEFFTKRSSVGRLASNAPQVFESERRASAARATLKNAEMRQKDLQVKSPIAGRVLTRRTEDLVGQYIIEGVTLVRIGRCDKMVAEVAVSERFLEYLKLGASITALVRTGSFQSWDGKVAAISPATLAQPATATATGQPLAPSAQPDSFVVLAVFDNPDGTLLPGSRAQVKIRANREAYGLRIWSVVWRWLRSIAW